MDSLMSDLKNIQTVAKDLLNQTGSDLLVPSWKFPEKLGSLLDPEILLKEKERDKKTLADDRLFITELIIDRLMFVLQCCIYLSDCTSGHKPANLPLTLGSTIRKFSKRIQHDQLAIKDLKEEISLKDKRIVTLEESVLTLKKENVTQLQDSIRNETSTVNLSNKPCVESSQQKLTMTNSADQDFQTEVLPEMLLAGTSTRLVHETNNVQTQTTSTVFTLCVRCSDTRDTLVNIAGLVSEVCYKHNQTSSIGLTDWKGLAAVEGLDINQWSTCFEKDLSSLELYTGQLEQTVKELEKDQIRELEIIENSQKKIDLLSSQVGSLQVSIDEIQAHNKDMLIKTREELGMQLNELKHNFSSLQTNNFKIKEELTMTRREEAQLQSRLIDLEQTKQQLQGDMQSIQSREIQQLSIKQDLERALEKTGGEVNRCKEQMESDKLELSKTKVYSQSLEKKNKSLVSKQAALLSQLDDIDQECTNLKEQLWKADKYKQDMSSEVVTIQAQYVKLQEKVETMTERLSSSQKKYKQLDEVYSTLEQQLGQTKNQLEDEREKCRLLIDYPFVKQTAQNYSLHIDSLSGKACQKQISANTVRILLLEEQNTELRQKSLPPSHQYQTTTQENYLKRPVQIWSNQLLSQVTGEQVTAREVSSSTDLDHYHSTDQLPHASKSTWLTKTNQPSTMKTKSTQRAGTSKVSTHPAAELTVQCGLPVGKKARTASSNSGTRHPLSGPSTATGTLKGRLGHLVTALAESQN